jgi:hypothetical protein
VGNFWRCSQLTSGCVAKLAKVLKYVKVFGRLGMVLVFLFIPSHICVRTVTGIPWFYSQSISVKQLTQVLPVLQDYRVTQYRNQDWCKVLIYQKGIYWFSNDPSTSTCVLGPETPSPFTQLAGDDFAELKKEFFLDWVANPLCIYRIRFC